MVKQTCFIYPYRAWSMGAKRLSEAMGVKRLRHDSVFKPIKGSLIVNWGASEFPSKLMNFSIVNHPKHVLVVSNKLAFFNIIENKDIIPPYTSSIKEANKWFSKKNIVVCRTVLSGSGGAGIIIAENKEQLVTAPLYTLYIPKTDEYRIHILRGKIIDQQRKARDRAEDDVDWRVRNHENGFIFARANVSPPKCVLAVALEAMEASGLDFGAVDVIYNDKRKRAYVLEINSAPGLEGTTVKNYGAAFRKEFL